MVVVTLLPRVVGCFLTYRGEFILVHRLPHKPDGDTWALPGGKVETGESDKKAMVRELREETGYRAKPDELSLLNEHVFTSSYGVDFEYVTFELILDAAHEMILEKSAHSEYIWTTVEDADKRDDLILGLHDLFRYVHYL